ncbi:hypothetical protein JTE90_013839 [Oedothorax gibbosus]|uniref:Transmembrane protein 151B n=1 Tax=Oedothorax gibbosus TaxID=931172 RepID=A0AAV6VLV3_9ARAC|nr:hypothetical protein JTE90_013839 [Oedothorax gibbosus]
MISHYKLLSVYITFILTPILSTLQQRPEPQGLCRSLRRDAHLKCLVLTILIACSLAALAWCQCARVTRLVVNFQSFPITTRRTASPCEEGYVFIPVAFMAMLYLVYLVECWHCTTRTELAYKVDSSTVYEHIQQMRETQPVIWWKAVCYHYVRRTRHVTRYRNGDAYTTTQVYYERVNSHGSGASFTYTNCGVKDISKKLLDLEKHPATKIRFSKGFAFANLEAANEFDEQRRRFFHENERLDDYMEMCEGLDLVGVNFQEHMVAFAEPHRLPWYVSHMIFWIFSLALLSWPLRVLIQYKTAYVHYQVNKLFGVNYLSPSSEAHIMIGCHMSRGTTIDSSEFERQIVNNNTIAPSYSESLLLRSSSSFMEQHNCSRPSRSSSTRRFSTAGIPVSISRSSLQNGRIVYYVSPLEDANNENVPRRLTDPARTQGADETSPRSPGDGSLEDSRTEEGRRNSRGEDTQRNSATEGPECGGITDGEIAEDRTSGGPSSGTRTDAAPKHYQPRMRDSSLVQSPDDCPQIIIEGPSTIAQEDSVPKFPGVVNEDGSSEEIPRISVEDPPSVNRTDPVPKSPCVRTAEDGSGSSEGQSSGLSRTSRELPPPPSYVDALRHCRPLFQPLLRRSATDRDIQRRLPMVFVHQGNFRESVTLGEHIEENEGETMQTSL